MPQIFIKSPTVVYMGPLAYGLRKLIIYSNVVVQKLLCFEQKYLR
jgi:hypothetical protein